MNWAAALWEHILVEYPTDALALRFAGDTYYYFGQSQSIRDSIARVLPAWRPDSHNFGFVLGRYAFGLEETGDLGKAERIARQALQIEPQDAWASHALARVFEAGAQPREGLEFLETGRGGWRSNCWLAAHLWWHSALYLIELGRGEEALQRYDEFIGSRLKADFFLDLIDLAADGADAFVFLAADALVVELEGALPGPGCFRAHHQALIDVPQVVVDHRVVAVVERGPAFAVHDFALYCCWTSLGCYLMAPNKKESSAPESRAGLAFVVPSNSASASFGVGVPSWEPADSDAAERSSSAVKRSGVAEVVSCVVPAQNKRVTPDGWAADCRLAC